MSNLCLAGIALAAPFISASGLAQTYPTKPAHDKAHDIAGRGIANPQAMRNAWRLPAAWALVAGRNTRK